MKHWLLSLLCLLLIKPAYAFDLENKMYLAEHYVSYTTSFDVSTDERKLGTLYRRVLSLNTVYDFYDIHNQIISTAKSHFFSYGAHLDIFAANNELLGTVEEKIFTWFPTFEIFSPEGLRLANAKMNFWGTTFTLYDGRSERVLAVMSRDFFRLRNYWTIEIKDMDRLVERHIDSRLLLTVLAVQGDIEYLENYHLPFNIGNGSRRLSMADTAKESIAKVNHKIRNKYADFLKKEAELNNVDLPNTEQLDKLATQLDQDFEQQYAGTPMSAEEQSERFVEHCMHVAESADSSTQKAILHLLNKRLSEQTGK